MDLKFILLQGKKEIPIIIKEPIYLDDTFLGGETDFPLLSKKIKM